MAADTNHFEWNKLKVKKEYQDLNTSPSYFRADTPPPPPPTKPQKSLKQQKWGMECFCLIWGGQGGFSYLAGGQARGCWDPLWCGLHTLSLPLDQIKYSQLLIIFFVTRSFFPEKYFHKINLHSPCRSSQCESVCFCYSHFSRCIWTCSSNKLTSWSKTTITCINFYTPKKYIIIVIGLNLSYLKVTSATKLFFAIK